MFNTKDYPFIMKKPLDKRLMCQNLLFFPLKNMVAGRKCERVHELGVRVCDGSRKYLGLPFLIGRTKKKGYLNTYEITYGRRLMGGIKEGKEILMCLTSNSYL